VIEVFAEYGVIGVMIVLFAGQMMFLQKTLMAKLAEIEEMVVALINRFNKTDDRADRRHEKLIGQMNYLTDDVNFLKGRINGGSRG
jgi:hypothetical protein|tara:strand:- start:213 stop:470 length:258 start_codon:yes stop_codon:yes gene_type:complete